MKPVQLDIADVSDDWYARALTRMRRCGYRPDERPPGPTFGNVYRKTVYLVACSKHKAAVPSAAKDLYVSPLFRLSREVAERHGHAWAILSARHGLLHPEEVIEPYDETLPAGDAARDWGYRAGRAIQSRLHGASLVALAGTRYLEPLRNLGIFPEQPLRGLQIGERLGKLAELKIGAAQ